MSDLDLLQEYERLIALVEQKDWKRLGDRLRASRKRIRLRVEQAIEGNVAPEKKPAGNPEGLQAAHEARRRRNVLKDVCYQIFKEEYGASHGGAAYQNKGAGEFVRLQKCLEEQMAKATQFTEETWRIACKNYFKTPFRSYTIAYLAVHYGEYYTAPRDRYGIPETVNGHSTSAAGRQQNVVNINTGLQKYGLLPGTTEDNRRNNLEEQGSLLPSATGSDRAGR